MSGRRPHGDYLDAFRRRVIQDALTEALPAYWTRRAATFAAVGNARCDATAAACRRHAEFLADNPVDLDELTVPAIREAA